MSRQHLLLITDMAGRSIPVSPFMQYWTLEELTHYYTVHVNRSIASTI